MLIKNAWKLSEETYCDAPACREIAPIQIRKKAFISRAYYSLQNAFIICVFFTKHIFISLFQTTSMAIIFLDHGFRVFLSADVGRLLRALFTIDVALSNRVASFFLEYIAEAIRIQGSGSYQFW